LLADALIGWRNVEIAESVSKIIECTKAIIITFQVYASQFLVR
jgi:hypothetical protein